MPEDHDFFAALLRQHYSSPAFAPLIFFSFLTSKSVTSNADYKPVNISTLGNTLSTKFKFVHWGNEKLTRGVSSGWFPFRRLWDCLFSPLSTVYDFGFLSFKDEAKWAVGSTRISTFMSTGRGVQHASGNVLDAYSWNGLPFVGGQSALNMGQAGAWSISTPVPVNPSRSHPYNSQPKTAQNSTGNNRMQWRAPSYRTGNIKSHVSTGRVLSKELFTVKARKAASISSPDYHDDENLPLYFFAGPRNREYDSADWVEFDSGEQRQR
ncbi:hypothetical protein IW261DRAFT_1592123 [Armillaria novae-zelandiae]|uniref:Uncharacterized protein n=1 Tax=Armillaria novae-zelandiae TaxID=153914 RepID=A0AA39PEF5_9AGAR|nr:hypothetical protein IW261DRAFT_1592123 [Armillaria novae-zelandiae]